MASTSYYSSYNAKMAELVPELKSKYGQCPMKRDKWVRASETVPNGQPAFIAHPKPSKGQTNPVKEDYVWGPGSKGFGYYHLTTQDAYKALGARLANEAVPGCGCFGGSSMSSKDKSDLKQIEILMYSRGQSPKPDDAYAKEHAIQANGQAFRPADDIGVWELKLKSKPVA